MERGIYVSSKVSNIPYSIDLFLANFVITLVLIRVQHHILSQISLKFSKALASLLRYSW